MSKVHVATIITADHLDKAYAMLESLRQFQDAHLHILVVNHHFDPLDPPRHEHVSFYRPNEIFEGDIGRLNRISFMKHSKIDSERPTIIAPLDYLRWALKPGFVHFLLEFKADEVVFCDCDLFFYADPIEILEYASQKTITISPHWRTIHNVTTDEIQYNFRHGLYNGGFFITTQDGKEVLEWWAEMCCVECSASSETTYVDQKYLDLVPLYFDNVGVIRHKGYNVAAWNLNYLPRTLDDDGKVRIDGDELIFIHFSPITIKWIENGFDYQLTEPLAQYRDALAKHRMNFYREGRQKYMSESISTEVI